MIRPRVYVDECVRFDVVIALRERGFVVSSAHNTVMAGKDDTAQLAHSTAIDVVIVTYNRWHFRRRHLQMQPHGGIAILADVALPLQEIRAPMLLDWLATMTDYRSQLFGWGALQQLLIGGFRLDGYTEDEVRRALGQ